MRVQIVPLVTAISLAGLAVPAPSFASADVTQGPQDRIEVYGPFALAKGPINRLALTQHYSRWYLYAE